MTSPNQEPNYRADAGTYHVQHDWTGGTELGTTILLALQRITGEDVSEQELLNRYVDPEALDGLFAPGPDGVPRNHGELSFPYAGSSITVRATGHVVIAPPPWVDAGEEGVTRV